MSSHTGAHISPLRRFVRSFTHRSKLDENFGRLVDFVSGYDNTAVPNLCVHQVDCPC